MGKMKVVQKRLKIKGFEGSPPSSPDLCWLLGQASWVCSLDKGGSDIGMWLRYRRLIYESHTRHTSGVI